MQDLFIKICSKTRICSYIGSHTVLDLLKAEYKVICVDNGCNVYIEPGKSVPESLKRVESLSDRADSLVFYPIDIRDKNALDEVFKKVSLIFYDFLLARWRCELEIFVCT